MNLKGYLSEAYSPPASSAASQFPPLFVLIFLFYFILIYLVFPNFKLIFVSSLFFIFLFFFFNFSCVIFAIFVKFLKEMMQDTRTEKSWKISFAEGCEIFAPACEICTSAIFRTRCEFSH